MEEFKDIQSYIIYKTKALFNEFNTTINNKLSVDNLIKELTDIYVNNPDFQNVLNQVTIEQAITSVLTDSLIKYLGNTLSDTDPYFVSILVKNSTDGNQYQWIFTISDNFFDSFKEENIGVTIEVDLDQVTESEIIDQVVTNLIKVSFVSRFVVKKVDDKYIPYLDTVEKSANFMDYLIHQRMHYSGADLTFEDYMTELSNPFVPADGNIINELFSTADDNLNSLMKSVNEVISNTPIILDDIKPETNVSLDGIPTSEETAVKFVPYQTDLAFLTTIINASGDRLKELSNLDLKGVLDTNESYRALVNSLAVTIDVVRNVKQNISLLIDGKSND